MFPRDREISCRILQRSLARSRERSLARRRDSRNAPAMPRKTDRRSPRLCPPCSAARSSSVRGSREGSPSSSAMLPESVESAGGKDACARAARTYRTRPPRGCGRPRRDARRRTWWRDRYLQARQTPAQNMKRRAKSAVMGYLCRGAAPCALLPRPCYRRLRHC